MLLPSKSSWSGGYTDRQLPNSVVRAGTGVNTGASGAERKGTPPPPPGPGMRDQEGLSWVDGS